MFRSKLIRDLICSAIFIVVANIFVWSQALAEPYINHVSGRFSDSETITINGANFGNNGPDIVIFDDFESGSNGNMVNTGIGSATVGGWTGNGHSALTTYSNAYKVSGSLAARCDMSSGSSYGQLKVMTGEQKDLFISWWMYLPSEDYYPGEDHPNRTNWKVIWLLGETLSDIDLIAPVLLSGGRWQLAGNHDCTYDPYDLGNPTEPRVRLDFRKGEWKRVWAWVKARHDASGEIYFWELDGEGVDLIYEGDGTRTHCNSSDMYRMVHINGYGRQSSNSHPTYDDVYVASGPHARARVEIGNAPTYNDCTNLTIATIDSWSDSTITATLRQGPFNAFNGTYLYVFDANGVVNWTGYPICSGCPSPPTNVRASSS